MAKEFIYTKTKEIGKLEENATVEIGRERYAGKSISCIAFYTEKWI